MLRFAFLVVLFAAGASAQTDLAGKPAQIFGTGDSKPRVLIFIRSDCPISNRYAPELERMYKEYSPRAAFYLVYADPAETADSIRKHMAEYGYALSALRDPRHVLVAEAKARVTPEAALFSAAGQLLYHGRIDDRYVDFGKARAQPTRHDLEDALRATLAGQPVQESSTRAIGCFLADVQ